MLGGYYYRVTEWTKENYELPATPSVAKAIWRRHNLLKDIIETTEPLPDIKPIDIEAEGIPANGIGNWTVGAFKGVERDEEAYRPIVQHSDSWNQCAGVLTYDGLQAFKVAEFLTLMAPEDAKPCQVESLARLRERMVKVPLGKLIAEEPVYLGDWRQLVSGQELTPKQWAECVTADAADVQLQVKAVYAAARLAEPAQERMAKVPGWTPTNCYVGTAKDSQTTTSGLLDNWQDNTRKPAMVFTTGSAYTIAAATLALQVAGSLTGELNIRIYAGDPTGAQTTLASGVINLAEFPTSTAFIWISLATAALSSGAVYTLELSTTATLDGTNYLALKGVATGGGAGNQYWLYSGGSWAAQGTKRFGFVTADNADGGKYIIRADGNSADIFGASSPKGAAVHTSDTYTVTMGATLTRNGNHTILQGRQGDTVTGSTPAYAAQSATYRYGYEVVNAGVTVTWTGAAAGASSGWLKNPATADTSSKSCALTINGTSGSRVKVTNSVDANNASYRWGCFNSYGPMNANYTDFYYSNAGIAGIYWSVAVNSGVTNSVSTFYQCTWDIVMGSNQAMITMNSIDMRVNFWSCKFKNTAGNSLQSFAGTPAAGGELCLSNIWTTGAFGLYLAHSSVDMYLNGDIIAVTDHRFSEATPADLTLTDTGTGGTLKATISNIASYADADRLCFYDGSGNVLACISKAAYVAALYNKDANCALITGLVNTTTYSGVYCKATRDSILYSAASGTASGTPTASSGGGGGTKSGFNTRTGRPRGFR